jgi:hypothetical protein
MPNRSYQITGKFAETENVSAGYRLMDLEVQGQFIHSNGRFIEVIKRSMIATEWSFFMPGTKFQSKDLAVLSRNTHTDRE